MKQRKVNLKGDPFRHVVTHALVGAQPGATYAARCSIKLVRGKITFAWRIFKNSIKPRAGK